MPLTVGLYFRCFVHRVVFIFYIFKNFLCMIYEFIINILITICVMKPKGLIEGCRVMNGHHTVSGRTVVGDRTSVT